MAENSGDQIKINQVALFTPTLNEIKNGIYKKKIFINHLSNAYYV